MQPSLASKLRMTLLMTFAVYPIVVIYGTIIGSLTPSWEFWQRSLVLVPFMATTIVMLIVPFITRHFGAFIAGKKPARAVA
jgi:antibiotic biosynthesis monooxygenase (ABM) superfamily enzyme